MPTWPSLPARTARRRRRRRAALRRFFDRLFAQASFGFLLVG